MTTADATKLPRRRRPVSVALSAEELAFCQAYGDGNASAGVRAMIRVCTHLQETSQAQRAARSGLRDLVTPEAPRG